MKLGTQTGSLVNSILSNQNSQPVLNGPATFFSWSDRDPGTVFNINVDGKGIVEVRFDDYLRTDSNGFSESQEYEYTSNPRGFPTFWKKDKAGKWVSVRKNVETGRWNKTGDRGIGFGFREKYHDHTF